LIVHEHAAVALIFSFFNTVVRQGYLTLYKYICSLTKIVIVRKYGWNGLARNGRPFRGTDGRADVRWIGVSTPSIPNPGILIQLPQGTTASFHFCKGFCE
jgi:hypothetical protein